MKALLVDSASVLVPACAAYPQLTYEGEYTGGVYGFIRHLSYLIISHKPSHLLVTRDHPPYLRRHTYPEYKGDRSTSGDEILRESIADTWPLVTRFCTEVLGVEMAHQEGYEADDLLAAVLVPFRDSIRWDDLYIIRSADTDLEQLFFFANVVMDRGKKGGIRYRGDFDKQCRELNISIDSSYDFCWFHAVVGTHNNVKGVHGVGPKTAAKLLADPDKRDQFHTKHQEVIERNIELIKLPYPGAEPPALHQPKVCSVREFEGWLGRLGITMDGAMHKAHRILSEAAYESEVRGGITRKRPDPALLQR